MDTNKHIHFMGISGIGMSAIALVLRNRGYAVSGCDLDITTSNCKTLEQAGCLLYNNHCSTGCSDPSIDTLVYTTMIDPQHEELKQARQRGIQLFHRSQMLGLLTQHSNTIAVSGSHGKTTTSALTGHLFLKSMRDPSIIIGGNCASIGGNARNGSSDILVIEADESDRSFLNFTTNAIIITNIDFEHLETYSSIQDVQNTFEQFTSTLVPNGIVVACVDDQYTKDLINKIPQKSISYGYAEGADWQITDAICHADYSTFSLKHGQTIYKDVTTPLAGKHNILNTTAALAVCTAYGIPFETIQHHLLSFEGVERRFTFKGTTALNARVFDDYGHHPKEIAATLEVAYRKPHNKLVVVFQPHRYTRTAGLWNEFLDLFINARIDELIVTDLHTAFEKPIANITSERFVEDLKIKGIHYPVSYIPLDPTFEHLTNKISSCTTSNDLILLQGAGKVTSLSSYIIAQKAL